MDSETISARKKSDAQLDRVPSKGDDTVTTGPTVTSAKESQRNGSSTSEASCYSIWIAKNRPFLIGDILLATCMAGVVAGVLVAQLRHRDGAPSTALPPPSSSPSAGIRSILPTPAPSVPTPPWNLKTEIHGNFTARFGSVVSLSGETVAVSVGDVVALYGIWGNIKGQLIESSNSPQLVRNGQTLGVVTSDDGVVVVYDWSRRDELWISREQAFRVPNMQSFALSENGDVLAISDMNGSITLFQFDYELDQWLPFGSENEDVVGDKPSFEKLQQESFAADSMCIVNYYDEEDDGYFTALAVSPRWQTDREDATNQQRSIHLLKHEGDNTRFSGMVYLSRDSSLPGGPSVSLSGDGRTVAIGGLSAKVYIADIFYPYLYNQIPPIIIEEAAQDDEEGWLQVNLSSDAKLLVVASLKHIHLYKFSEDTGKFQFGGGMEMEKKDEKLVSFSLGRDANYLAVSRQTSASCEGAPVDVVVEIFDFSAQHYAKAEVFGVG